MGMRGIRLGVIGMRGIRVRMRRIGVGMRGIGVEMWRAGGENEGNRDKNLRKVVEARNCNCGDG